MLKLAVVGKDVSKSLSGKMHSFILNGLQSSCEYELVSVAPENFDEKVKYLLSEKDAFNVTIPYKLTVMSYLKEIKGDAKTFGAVNTVKNYVGYNTDGEGFMLLLKNNGVETQNKKVLVLGTGGAGRSVIKKLIDAGANVYAYDLNQQNLQAVYQEFGGFTPLEKLSPENYYMIINVTGVGMHKTEGISPVGAEILNGCEVAVDLIYEPKKSEFLRIAESLGKKILNGEGMLFYQAYYADCIYLDREQNAEEAKKLFESYKKEI